MMGDRNFSHSSYYRLKLFSLQLLQEIWKKIHLICYIFQETALLPSYPSEMGKLTGKQPQFWCLRKTTPHTALLRFTTLRVSKMQGTPPQSTSFGNVCFHHTRNTCKLREALIVFSHHSYYRTVFNQADGCIMLSFKQNNGEKSLVPMPLRDQTPQQWSSLSVSRPSVLPSITFAAWPGCRYTGEPLAG